jgi:oxygen-independent coproporphyrinogen-3 oxidase
MSSGLYIHVPFCARACPYCDFDFVVGRAPDLDGYLEGLSREADERGEEAASGRRFATVYVGGGTPSSLGAAGLSALMRWIERRFPGAGGDEITVEVNPEHADVRLLGALAAAGVGRISMGIQTFEDAGLRELGRAHSGAEAAVGLQTARTQGLRVSSDLIVGWRGQTPSSLRDDVARAIDGGAEHVSVYALTIEERSAWPKLVRRGLRVLPDDDHQAELLVVAEEALRAAGFTHYEVASYALGGAQARHNMLYWTWQEYLGLGPSGSSARYARDGSVRRRTNARGLAAWAAGAPPEVVALGPVEAAIEGLWVGLRRLTGLEVEDFLARFPAVDRGWIERRSAGQRARGNLEWAEQGRLLRVVAGRWLWHDSIGADLLG